MAQSSPTTLHRILTLHCCSSLDVIYSVRTEWQGVGHRRMYLSSSKINPTSSEGEEEPITPTRVGKNFAPYKFSKVAVNNYPSSSSLDSDLHKSIVLQDDSANLLESTVGGVIFKITGTGDSAPMLGTSLASVVSESRGIVILFYQGKDNFIYFVTRGTTASDKGDWSSPARVNEASAVARSGLSTMKWLDNRFEHVGVAFKPAENQLQICATSKPHATSEPHAGLSFKDSTRLDVPGLHNSSAIARARYPLETGALFDKYYVSYQRADDLNSLFDLWAQIPRHSSGKIEYDKSSVAISAEIGIPGSHDITSISITHHPQSYNVQIAYATAWGVLFSRALSYKISLGTITLDLKQVQCIINHLAKQTEDGNSATDTQLCAQFQGLLNKMQAKDAPPEVSVDYAASK